MLLLLIIPSTPVLPVHLHIRCSLLFTICAWFPPSRLIPSRPQANFPTVPFPTSSFLSPSLLIYLSCWAPARSDALPLCLCCMCVICIPYLPRWNSLLCARPRWPHPNHSLCWAVTGARPLKITLHWASSLSAGLFPADVANAAYYHRAPALPRPLSFSSPFYSLISRYIGRVSAGRVRWRQIACQLKGFRLWPYSTS